MAGKVEQSSTGKLLHRGADPSWSARVLLSFGAEILKLIYRTKAVESLNVTRRKVIKTCGSFPSEDAALKLLYLAFRNVSKKWHTVLGWPQALNRFAILREDRFPQLAN